METNGQKGEALSIHSLVLYIWRWAPINIFHQSERWILKLGFLIPENELHFMNHWIGIQTILKIITKTTAVWTVTDFKEFKNFTCNYGAVILFLESLLRDVFDV